MCATDAAFHLVHKIDVEHTQARLAHYEALNKAHIAQHQQQREQESAQQDEADAVARHERLRRAQQVREEQEREQLEQDADEKALVAALEEGRDIDDAMREREARREARVAAARQRELAAARQRHDAVPTAPRVLSAEAQAYAHEVGQSDYVGAFATLRDGTQLCDARGAPPSAGGLGGSGYVDPWWRTDAALGAQFRAGGYDWQHEVWQRGLASLCDGVSLRPM